jgi:hypothetical protein
MALPLLGLLGSFAARKSIETVARYIMRDGAKKTLARLVKEFPGRNSRSINKIVKDAEKQIADAKKMYDKVKKGDVPTTGKFVQTKITPKSAKLESALSSKTGKIRTLSNPKINGKTIVKKRPEPVKGQYVRKDRVQPGEGRVNVGRSISSRSDKKYVLKDKAGSPTTSFLKKEKGRMEKIKDRVEATLKKNKLKATGLTTAALIGVAATVDTDKPKKKTTTTAKKQTTRKDTRPKPNPKNLENYMGGAGGIRVRKKRKK